MVLGSFVASSTVSSGSDGDDPVSQGCHTGRTVLGRRQHPDTTVADALTSTARGRLRSAVGKGRAGRLLSARGHGSNGHGGVLCAPRMRTNLVWRTRTDTLLGSHLASIKTIINFLLVASFESVFRTPRRPRRRGPGDHRRPFPHGPAAWKVAREAPAGPCSLWGSGGGGFLASSSCRWPLVRCGLP